MCQITEKFETTKILDKNILYSDIFGSDSTKQKVLSTWLLELLDIKERLIKENEPETLYPCTSVND